MDYFTFRTLTLIKSSLAVNTCWFLDASLQKSGRDFFMRDLDHLGAERLVFCAIISKHCNVVATTARQWHGDT